MFKYKYDYIKVERLFLVVAIILGITFSLLNGPFQGPDENVHFYRAYQISTGEIMEEHVGNKIGGYLPKSILKTYKEVSLNVAFHTATPIDTNKFRKYLNVRLDKKNVAFEDFSTAAMYSPIVYIPQAIGIEIGKIFGLSPLILMYLGRISNLICWAIIVYIALKILPFKKLGMAFLALAPMSLYQASSLSSDAITNALAFLSIALILRYAFDEKLELRRKHLIYLFVLLVALSLCKQVYFAFVLLFLLIPRKKFKSTKVYFITFICLIFSCIAFLGIWSVITSSSTEFSKGAVVPGEQVKFVLKYPFYYIRTIWNTFVIQKQFYFHSYIAEFGWLDTLAPRYVYKVFTLGFLLILIFDDGIKLNTVQRIIFVVTFLSLIVLVMTALYVIWTNVGASAITGVQGRYFIPIIPLVFFIFNWKNRHSALRVNILTTVVMLATTANLIFSAIRLANRFYGI